jgi:hypothetical protein
VDEYTDEVLMTIAEGAGGLVAAVGGGETGHSLLPLLEALAEKEETVVRAKVTSRPSINPLPCELLCGQEFHCHQPPPPP